MGTFDNRAPNVLRAGRCDGRVAVFDPEGADDAAEADMSPLNPMAAPQFIQNLMSRVSDEPHFVQKRRESAA